MNGMIDFNVYYWTHSQIGNSEFYGFELVVISAEGEQETIKEEGLDLELDENKLSLKIAGLIRRRLQQSIQLSKTPTY